MPGASTSNPLATPRAEMIGSLQAQPHSPLPDTMGFWHTGYIEFHEPTGLENRPPPRPPNFVCDRCGRSFRSSAARDEHRFTDHPLRKPAMFVRGRQLGARRTTITAKLSPSMVRAACDRAWINGREIPPRELPAALANGPTSPDACRIVLRKDGVDATFNMEFSIASHDDLACVESRFHEIARRGKLDSRIVDDFIGTKSHFQTAIGYCGGICDYLYGTLARERAPRTTLPPSDYELRFNSAAETLAGYDRPLARTIASLIEFHFNHFAESASLAPGSRAATVAAQYLRWTRPDMKPKASCTRPPTAASTLDNARLERLLTDEMSERILRWSQRPLLDLAADADDITACLTHDLPHYDQSKLHVLLAEFHAAHGHPDRALDHARSLRHTAPFEQWATTLIASLRE